MVGNAHAPSDPWPILHKFFQKYLLRNKTDPTTTAIPVFVFMTFEFYECEFVGLSFNHTTSEQRIHVIICTDIISLKARRVTKATFGIGKINDSHVIIIISLRHKDLIPGQKLLKKLFLVAGPQLVSLLLCQCQLWHQSNYMKCQINVDCRLFLFPEVKYFFSNLFFNVF